MIHDNTDQLNYGVRLLAEKHATNYGDCEALVSFIRDSIGEYHLQGKVFAMHSTSPFYWPFCRSNTDEGAY